MNANYEQLSSTDVARILKVDRTSITKWCQNGWIKYTDISGPGSSVARYVFDEEDILRIKELRQKYGKRKWVSHYKEDCKLSNKTTKPETPWVLEDNSAVANKDLYPIVPVGKEEPVKVRELDEDKLLNSILHIREIKDEIENCKARLAQLENEYAECKQEIVNWL